ncbi:MAG: sugar phosphate isomerase/epimerase family protein [Bacillota bacterium]
MMLLGGPIFEKVHNPDEWISQIKKNGYTAAYCPDLTMHDAIEIAAYKKAAKDANIVIAEVGAWSNPISTNDSERKKAIKYCQEKLALAEEIGSLCCVNIAGSKGIKWDGPHGDNFSNDTFTLIVDSIREIIDAVKPQSTYYTLEMMPWIYPNSADSYIDLLRTIDHKAFAVHLDIVNIINSPQQYFNNTLVIKECFQKLGPYIKSCHAKDIILEENLTVHLNETRPGLGNLDYLTFIKEVQRLRRDVPIMLEHLSTKEDYQLAASYIRKVVEKTINHRE